MAIGLTSAEAAQRLRDGQGNNADLRSSRSLQDIFISNFLNIANVILLGIVMVLLIVGSVGDAFVTGGVVVVNIIIGTFQEYRSKRKLDQIALLTRPKVTVLRDGKPQEIDQAAVVLGDAIVFQAGDQAVVDGAVVQTDPETVPRVDVDESLLTGESDLIAKRPGDEILSGSFAVVGEAVYIAEKVGNDSFAQKLTAGAREYTNFVTPLQEQISIIVRVLVVLAVALSILLGLRDAFNEQPFNESIEDMAVVVSLIPQGLLLMITVAYALGAVRIAGKGALVQKSNAVESLSNVNVLCMDKTGTLTTNRILFDALHPMGNTELDSFKTVMGTYIVSTGAKNRTAEALADALPQPAQKPVAEIPFSSARKWSGASFDTDMLKGTYILGAPEMVLPEMSIDTQDKITELANQGLRVLAFAQSPQMTQPEDIPDDQEPALPSDLAPIGLISFSDELRPNVQDVLAGFRTANIQLRVISGDNPETVAALAYQAGFDPETDKGISGVELATLTDAGFVEAVRTHTIFGRITPEQKQRIVDILRDDGYYVAMMGDGVNDVLSLKKAQVGIAMEDGSQATRSVADIVLLGNRFEVLPDAFIEGQRILNGMNDNTRLFLTRTLYAALLIVLAGFIGSEFPYSPRHNALLTSLPVGIPAFFLSYWARGVQPKKNLLRMTTEFVFPAGTLLMLCLSVLWIFNYDEQDVMHSQSLLTIASLGGGLLVIVLAGFDRDDWYQWDTLQSAFQNLDPRRIGLMIAMFIGFLIVMAIEGARDFFEMTIPNTNEVFAIVGVVGAWLVGIALIWRFDVFEWLLIPNYRPELRSEQPAGGADRDAEHP